MDILKVIEVLKEAWNRLNEGQRDKQIQFRRALKALSKALNETRICLGRPQVTREDEETLSRLWARAGISVSEFDHDLALRCDMKASYWANPKRWTDQELEAAKIEINQMQTEIKSYFKGKPKKSKKKGKKGET